MKRSIASILFSSLLVCIWLHAGWAVTGDDIVRLKKAGISDKTIQLIVKEKAIETAAFSVDDLVNMKKAGVSEKTLQSLIEEGSFTANREPIVYGRNTQTIRNISPQDVIDLKRSGVSDSVIQSVIEATRSSDVQERERAWRMLENMRLRIYVPGGR